MSLIEIMQIALKSLLKNKTRTFLTMLGIIIGVGAVITMLAIGQGAKRLIEDQIQSVGTNVITIMTNFQRSAVRTETGEANRLSLQDLDAIIEQVPGINYITPVIGTGGQLRYRSLNWRTRGFGVDTDYFFIRNYDMDEGEMFSNLDVERGAKVIVLGKTIADHFFPEEDPIGKLIRHRNTPVRVVGVLSSKGQSTLGGDLDDIYLMPYTTVLQRYINRRFPNMTIYVSTVSRQVIPFVQRDITQVLLSRYSNSTDEDFLVNSQKEMAQMASNVSDTMTLLLASIAGISLVVGGIGIMNIMLVSVSERIKEIGLRMAVGAKKNDVLLQFVVEAIFISGIGGIFGIIAGSICTNILGNIMNWHTEVTLGSVFLAVSFSCLIGVFFGWYPAKKAANLNLIDALRYE
ncbi:MAG: ABC transporter permease [Candidatus Cloacimonetes bacterium]|nr:ABC transporter permease [Candidatus Cloacimonadota bacterium]